ncbi:MAG TPA: hypothetical protein VJQ46_02820 [Gemmatimonadales bacterium]|nr:hypothetical protein [Gemmatimonadales bacterium]
MAAVLAGCGALDVSDPTAIQDEDLANPTGADLLRRDAIRQWYISVADGALASGLLADEFMANTPGFYHQFNLMNRDELLDRRQSLRYEQETAASGGGSYGQWQGVRRAATVALPRLRAYSPASVPTAYLGEVFAVRAFATLSLAENVCAGFPLHDVADAKLVYGGPLTTDQAFEHAVADFDSALSYAADSARILSLVQVGRARALLGRGLFTEAAAAAAPVPTEFAWQAEYSVASGVAQPNPLAFGFVGNVISPGPMSRTVADREGGTGLDFIGANDPRLGATQIGVGEDGVTGIYRAAKYSSEGAPIVVASGVEARLIEAEAALQLGGDWLAPLNALRTSCTDAATCPDPAPAGTGGVAGLPPLADPGTPDARIDLLFRERAFWLFGTGQRLGDLRRLIAQYGRASESVFPTGAYWLGDTYESATSLPFPAAQEAPYNPAVTGCITR